MYIYAGGDLFLIPVFSGPQREQEIARVFLYVHVQSLITKNLMYMEPKQKQVYSAPLSELLELTQEGVICGSLNDYNWNDYDEE